jgi:DNA repair protein RadA/Sms
MKNCIRCNAGIDDDCVKCPKCDKWQHIYQEPEEIARSILLSEVEGLEVERIETGLVDLTWGGGIALPSVTLLGGLRGVGKSTLVLQIGNLIAGLVEQHILYVSAEQGAAEIKYLADRLRLKNQSKIKILPALGGDVDIMSEVEIVQPQALIIDSLPGLVGYGSAHDSESIDLCTGLKEYASNNESPVIIIDHITKDESFAGRETLQHLVDTLITFKADDKNMNVKVLEAEKNRFGPAFDPTRMYFEMTKRGLMPFRK